jgi:hypothetical protein
MCRQREQGLGWRWGCLKKLRGLFVCLSVSLLQSACHPLQASATEEAFCVPCIGRSLHLYQQSSWLFACT